MRDYNDVLHQKLSKYNSKYALEHTIDFYIYKYITPCVIFHNIFKFDSLYEKIQQNEIYVCFYTYTFYICFVIIA